MSPVVEKYRTQNSRREKKKSAKKGTTHGCENE
jgi:hypothetical protein